MGPLPAKPHGLKGGWRIVNDIAKAVLIVVVIIALGLMAVSYIKTIMGKSVRHKLMVPLGRETVEVLVRDGALLKPYKFSQVFDAQAVMGPTGEVGLLFKGKEFGIADPTNGHCWDLIRVLKHDETATVIVQAMVYGINAEGDPLVRLMLPRASWFKRALKD